jgi:hypothetical protein
MLAGFATADAMTATATSLQVNPVGMVDIRHCPFRVVIEDARALSITMT